MNRTLRLFIALLALAILPLAWGSAGPAQPAGAAAPTAKQLRELLEPIRKKHDLPALGAAVVNSKGVVALAAVGVRKRGEDVPVTPEDRFHLGSDTKAMTATMIASLVESGKLTWETTLEKAFPDLAPLMAAELRKVTLVQLLTHHAGLRRDLKGGWWQIPREGTTREQRKLALKLALAEKPVHAPGTKYLYSSLGYVAAGAMAEEATGETWEALMEKRLFKPLGMTTTGYGAMGRPGKAEQPWGHENKGRPVEPGPLADNPPVMGPAGRVHCSLGDWGKFIADQLRGARGERALLRTETYKKLHSSPFKDEFYTVGGWAGEAKDPRAGGLVLSHDGCNTMNYALAWLAPGRDFAVIVVANQDMPAGEEGCHEALMQILKRFLPQD
jgi:CubicO group peptidase (beta-lactamase class C family)